MLITFEGIDGCGKTTQLKKLKEYLESLGKSVIMLREPGGTDFSEKIREILLYSRDAISARAELLLFESARAHLVETVIKPALGEGKIVLCDRFFDSTTAYQGYGRGLDLGEIKQCNLIATGGLVPNATFFLNLSLEQSKIRSHNRYQDRMEKAGDAFFERVIEGFSKIAQNEPDRFFIIDASGTVEHTSNRINEIVKNYIK